MVFYFFMLDTLDLAAFTEVLDCNVLQGTFVEGVKEEVVLSPAHALSLIAAGEGKYFCLIFSYTLVNSVLRKKNC